MKLNRKFFNRPTVKVARELLGKLLVRKKGNKIIKAKITETEAYCGTRDLACHASRGLTERTKVMFGPPGHAYVYMIYGMYHCLNIVTEREGNPSAVLVRAVELAQAQPLVGHGINSCWNFVSYSARPASVSSSKGSGLRHIINGPGKSCRELKIDRKLNGIDITKSDLLWIEDDKFKIKRSQIKKGKRIGVDYAGKWKDKLWRFYL